MKKEFYSNGKLLLSGEYAILDGAIGLGLPTTYGQSLTVEENDSGTLHWVSLDYTSNIWFEALYKLNSFEIVETTNREISDRLIQILSETKKLNPLFLFAKGYSIKAKLTFPKDWGLGSSSTLINNIANWGAINPYQLLNATFGGSGYDIACASHPLPILYKTNNLKPFVKEVAFNPSFSDSLYFIYLNQKQNSRDAIKRYDNLDLNKSELINKITSITEQLVSCNSLTVFETLLSEHEQIISKAIDIAPIKERLFSDYSGAIKSLGAWGGDFIIATGSSDTPDYFKEKGYTTVIPYADMIL